MLGFLDGLKVPPLEEYQVGSTGIALRTQDLGSREVIGESPECHGTARGTYCEVGLSDVLTGRFMDCEILKPHWQPSHSALSDRLDDIKTENRYMHLDHSSKVDAMAKGLAGLEVRLKISSSHDDGGYPMITPTDETGVIAMKIPEELAARLRDLMSLESDAAREQVLVSLNFHARPVRHASISDAYSNTFNWIFKPEFAKWLQGTGGLFWISGKSTTHELLHRTVRDFLQTREMADYLVTKLRRPFDPSLSIAKAYVRLDQVDRVHQ